MFTLEQRPGTFCLCVFPKGLKKLVSEESQSLEVAGRGPGTLLNILKCSGQSRQITWPQKSSSARVGNPTGGDAKSQGAILTHRQQVQEVLITSRYSFLLGQVQQPQLLLGEGHSHILEGQCLPYDLNTCSLQSSTFEGRAARRRWRRHVEAVPDSK